MRKSKKRSMITLFSIFGCVAFVLLAVSVLLMYNLFSTQIESQNLFVERNSTSNQLMIDIDDVYSSLNNWRNNWEDEYYYQYLENNNNLINTIDSLLSTANRYSEDYIIQVQHLKNFEEYQRNAIMQSLSTPTELFNVTAFVTTGLQRHQQELRRVVQQDMIESYNEFFAKEEQTRQLLIALLIGFLISFLFLLSIFIRYVRNLLQSINAMRHSLSEISKQNWDTADLKETYFSEIEILYLSINKTKYRLEDYFKKLQRQSEIEQQLAEERLKSEKQRVELVSAQMDTLRSQVNPHFLFNALHQISMATLVEPPERTMKLTEAIGKILRYALYNKDSLVPLSDELEIVKLYIYIQEFSSGHVDYKISEGFDSSKYLIVPMCIQPLVENSFKHGMRKSTRPWRLEISTEERDGFITVTVFDNGPGMDPGQQYSSKSHIGLGNIEKRLFLEYSIEGLLNVDSVIGHYTKISVSFPIREATCEGTDS